MFLFLESDPGLQKEETASQLSSERESAKGPTLKRINLVGKKVSWHSPINCVYSYYFNLHFCAFIQYMKRVQY